MLAGAGNLAAFLKHHTLKSDQFIFDIGLVGRAGSFVYFSGFMAPLAVALIARAVGKKIDPVKIICIYGYSYTIYVICAVVAVYPNDVSIYALFFYLIERMDRVECL